MKSRVIIPALLLMLVSTEAWCNSIAVSNKFHCTHILELHSPLTHLSQGVFERSLNWAEFANASSKKLSQSLQIEQFISFNENPHIFVDVLRGEDLLIVSCESLTVSPRNLMELKNKIAAGNAAMTPSEHRIVEVNEKYQIAVDTMSECSQAPISPQNLLYPLFRYGFQIFTGTHTAFLLSKDLRWLALCSDDGANVDLRSLREETFRFLADPAVTHLLNCEERLISLEKRK